MIMEEYEKTISQVVTMREDDKKKFEIEKEQLASERDESVHHLRNMEIAFNDVHQWVFQCYSCSDKPFLKAAISVPKIFDLQYNVSEGRITVYIIWNLRELYLFPFISNIEYTRYDCITA